MDPHAFLVKGSAQEGACVALLFGLLTAILWWKGKSYLRTLQEMPSFPHKAEMERASRGDWRVALGFLALMVACPWLGLLVPNHSDLVTCGLALVIVLLLCLWRIAGPWMDEAWWLQRTVTRARRRKQPFDLEHWRQGAQRRLRVWRLVYILLGCLLVAVDGPVLLWRYGYDESKGQEGVLQKVLQSWIAAPDVEKVQAYIMPPPAPYSPRWHDRWRRFTEKYASDHVLFIYMKAQVTPARAQEVVATAQKGFVRYGRRERWRIRVWTGPPYRLTDGWYEPGATAKP